MATMRYLVHDVTAAVKFYEALGFELKQLFGPNMPPSYLKRMKSLFLL